MKKAIALVLALIMTASLFTGCGAKEEEKKVLTMATNAEFPPYEYYEGDKVVGIDAEVAALIAEKLGMGLEIVDIEFNSIIPGISSGKYNIGMAGMTVTEDRLESVNFTSSYTTAVQVVIVKEGGTVTSLDDLFEEGHDWKIGVQNATTGDIYASGDFEDAGLGTVSRYDKGADAVAALLADKIDCVIIDNEPAKNFVAANEGLTILDTEYALEEYAICYSKDDTAIGEQVDKALQELIADGSVQKVIDKYIPAE